MFFGATGNPYMPNQAVTLLGDSDLMQYQFCLLTPPLQQQASSISSSPPTFFKSKCWSKYKVCFQRGWDELTRKEHEKAMIWEQWQLERNKEQLGWNCGRTMAPAETYSEDLIILSGGILTSKCIHTGAADKKQNNYKEKNIEDNFLDVNSCQPLAPDH